MYRTINSTHKEQSFKHSQYLRLATIGIENPHGIISAVNTRHCKYNSISTNPKVPITQLHRLLRRNARLWRIPIIYLFENHQSILNLNPKKKLKIFFFLCYLYQNEVVAEAVVLDEVKEASLSSVKKRRRSSRGLLWSLGAHGRSSRRWNAKPRA